jgi:hypothetical protein
VGSVAVTARRLVALILVLGWLFTDVSLTIHAQSPASQKRDEPIPLLDIARVVPYPADFDDQIAGIGFVNGRFFPFEEDARRAAAAAAGNASAANVQRRQRGLGEASWLQRYESRLAAPSANNSDTFEVQFSSFVVEYVSPEEAGAAFATLVADDRVVESPVVGNESTLTLLSGVTPDTGSEYQAARLVFRVGPMLSMIVYADLLNREPDLVLLNSVAQRVAARAAVVAERETVPLATMALPLDPAGATSALVRRDLYNVRAGALTALSGENDADRARRVELFTGTMDAYSSSTSGAFSLAELGQLAQSTGRSGQVATAAPTPTSVIRIEGEPATARTVSTPRAGCFRRHGARHHAGIRDDLALCLPE